MDKMETKKSHSEEWLFYIVVPPGIEPGTQGFSVLCSTIWAMAPTALILRVQRYALFLNLPNYLSIFCEKWYFEL